jgi:hypothetical protein
LLSKRYHATNDHRFSEQLHRSAVVVGSRKVLYQLIHKAEHVEPESTLPSPVPAQNIEVKMRFRAVEVVSQPTALPPAAEKTETAAAPKATPVRESEPASPQQNLATLAGDILDHETPTAPASQSDVLPKLHTSEKEVTATREEQHAEPQPTFKASDLDPLERGILIEAVQSSIEQEVGSEVEQDSTDSESDSYAAWLTRRAQELHFGADSSEIEEDTETQSLEDDAENEENSEPQENPVLDQIIRDATSKKPGASNPKQANLIDRFIKLEPKIAAGKAGEYTPGNIAKESLEEDFSLVTETMAQLFAKQGKLDKARKAYRKLIEQHPEKSVYFAAQLKNIDKLKKG